MYDGDGSRFVLIRKLKLLGWGGQLFIDCFVVATSGTHFVYF